MALDYRRPASLEEALAGRASDPGAAWLAGGTILLAGDRRERPSAVFDLEGLLPRGIERRPGPGGSVEIALGAGATFQDLVDSAATPSCLRAAALGMANRNVRNRATLGGNVAAGKACASLIPALLILEARVLFVLAGGDGRAAKRELPLAGWLAEPRGIILELHARVEADRKAASLRWGRSACDLAVLTVAAGFRPGPAGSIEGLRVAIGGAGPRARRFPEIEALLEGRALPPKAEIEGLAARLLPAVDDHRGGAAFKRLRGAALLADALHDAMGGAGEAGA